MILQLLAKKKEKKVQLKGDTSARKKRRRPVEQEDRAKKARLATNHRVHLIDAKPKATVQSQDDSGHVDLTQRYKSEYANDVTVYNRIVAYMKSPNKVIKPLMIRGPSGCGKGAAVYKAAINFKTQVQEIDLDEYKTIQSFLDTKVVRNFTMSENTVAHRKQILLVRGLEGYPVALLRKLKSEMNAAYASYEASGRRTHVVVFTATHQYDRHVKPLEGICGMVVWMRPLHTTMLTRLFDRVMRDYPVYRHMLRKRTQLITDARGDARSMFNTMMLNEVDGTLCVDEKNQRDICGPEGFFDYMKVFFERRPGNPEHLYTTDSYTQMGVFLNALRYAFQIDSLAEFNNYWSVAETIRSEQKEVDVVEYEPIRAQLMGEYAQMQIRLGGFRTRARDNKVLMPNRQVDSASQGTSMRRCVRAQSAAAGHLVSSNQIHDRLMLPETTHPIHPHEYQKQEQVRFMNNKNKLVVPARVIKQTREQSKGDRIVLTSAFKSVVPDAFKATAKVLQPEEDEATGLSASSFLLS